MQHQCSTLDHAPAQTPAAVVQFLEVSARYLGVSSVSGLDDGYPQACIENTLHTRGTATECRP